MKFLNNLLAFFFLLIHVTLLAQDYGSWMTIDSLHETRMNHAGIQLDNGNILITGGYTPTEGYGTNSTEILDMHTMKWKQFVSMNKGRAYHKLIKLINNNILAVGGFSDKSCEILDINRFEWQYTDSLINIRWYGWGAQVMDNGNILVSGGYLGSRYDSTAVLSECEIYDYIKREWNATTALQERRFDHTSTLLPDGKILVTGGKNVKKEEIKLKSCELFDPLTYEWKYAAPMKYARSSHSATLLKNGNVLVIGGHQDTCEIYDPISNEWHIAGVVSLSTGHNKAIKFNNDFLLLIHDYDEYISRPGWELYSLSELKSVHREPFTRIIYDQVILQFDDNSAIIIGGQEILEIESDIIIIPTGFCSIYNMETSKMDEIDFLAEESSISIYPNPVRETLNVRLKINQSETITVELYNILGQKIKTNYNNLIGYGETHLSLNMQNIPPGCYFIVTHYGSKMNIKKIIHQK